MIPYVTQLASWVTNIDVGSPKVVNMILRGPAMFFLSLVIAALLMALTLGVASGSSHVITGQYIDVGPDGYWDAEVAAGGHQQWNFDLAAQRDHNLVIIGDPVDASLSVSINGQHLGTVSGVTSFSSGSGSSAGIVLLAGGVTLIVAIVATSAWYTRRRWLRS